MIKAQVTEVPIGSLTVQGLMSEDGTFGVAIPQTALLINSDTGHAATAVKRLLGKASNSRKSETELLQWKTEFAKRPVNVLTLKQFEMVLVESAFTGNEKAQNIVRALTGLSLHQLWADAFGVKMGAEERQQFLLGELKALELEKERDYYQTGMIKANMRASQTRKAAAEKRAMVRAFEGFEKSRGANKVKYREEFYKLAEGKGVVDYRNLDELAPVEVPPLLNF